MYKGKYHVVLFVHLREGQDRSHLNPVHRLWGMVGRHWLGTNKFKVWEGGRKTVDWFLFQGWKPNLCIIHQTVYDSDKNRGWGTNHAKSILLANSANVRKTGLYLTGWMGKGELWRCFGRKDRSVRSVRPFTLLGGDQHIIIIVCGGTEVYAQIHWIGITCHNTYMPYHAMPHTVGTTPAGV